MTFYDQKLPDELVTHTLAMCGDRGRAWLDDLPKRIADFEQKWAIEVLEPFPAGEFNFVAPAIRNRSENVVIKIAPPFENHEARGEARFLRTLNGDGTVGLLAEDRQLEALLLERALPGNNLAEVFSENESSCLSPAIEILKRILRPVPSDLSDVLLLDDWFNGLRRSRSTDFPAVYADKALELYDNVLKHQPKHYLHGDFHPANIVSAQRSPFLAIDPKGIVGPIGYDIAVFLNNYHWWQETRADIRERLEIAVCKFAEAFRLAPITLRQWAFSQMVLGAWWTFDEMPQVYNNAVAKADIWDV